MFGFSKPAFYTRTLQTSILRKTSYPVSRGLAGLRRLEHLTDTFTNFSSVCEQHSYPMMTGSFVLCPSFQDLKILIDWAERRQRQGGATVGLGNPVESIPLPEVSSSTHTCMLITNYIALEIERILLPSIHLSYSRRTPLLRSGDNVPGLQHGCSPRNQVFAAAIRLVWTHLHSERHGQAPRRLGLAILAGPSSCESSRAPQPVSGACTRDGCFAGMYVHSCGDLAL